MADNRRFEIRIAGFGGQGVVTVGKVLGTALTVYGGRNSVNTQSYGPESRGGACRSEVVCADGRINYPYVRAADVLVALSQVALDAYIENVKPGGIVLTDTQAVQAVPGPERFRTVPVPTLEIAQEVGDVKCQNMVALGALFPLIEDRICESDLMAALKDSLPEASMARNIEAFHRGKHYVQSRSALEA